MKRRERKETRLYGETWRGNGLPRWKNCRKETECIGIVTSVDHGWYSGRRYLAVIPIPHICFRYCILSLCAFGLLQFANSHFCMGNPVSRQAFPQTSLSCAVRFAHEVLRTHTCICPLPPLTGHAHLQRCLPSHATRIPTRPILTYPLFLTFFSSALAALAALAALVGIAAQPRLASLTHYVHHA